MADEAHGKHLRCGTCSNILATISASGVLEPNSAPRGACDTCRAFDELHAAMILADEQFKEVQDRRFDFGGRITALAAQRETRKTFANFLLSLEQTDVKNTEEKEQGVQKASAEDSEAIPREKRERESATPDEDAQPKRKKVSFDEAVVFRGDEDYRKNSLFSRSHEDYLRGRFAPPDGEEYLDTSGCDMEYKDFHNLKWIGRKWVSVVESVEREDGETGLENGT